MACVKKNSYLLSVIGMVLSVAIPGNGHANDWRFHASALGGISRSTTDSANIEDYDGTVFGAELGAIYMTKAFGLPSPTMFELAVEYLDIDNGEVRANDGTVLGFASEFTRTDLKLVVGQPIGNRFMPFVGVRSSWRGDGFFDDSSGYKEPYGYIVGASVVLYKGDLNSIGFSAAYNRGKRNFTGGGSRYGDRYSARLTTSFGSIPFDIGLLWRVYGTSGSSARDSYYLGVIRYNFG